MQQIQYIKTNQIYASSMNPRKEFDQAGIDELAESIRQVGILQPIIARQDLNLKKNTFPIYEVVCGSRRLSAAVIADLKEVPVIVRELSDDEAFDLMITENLQRKDVSPIEEGLAFQKLIEKGTYDVSALSERFGKSHSYIRQRIKINDLIDEFKRLLINDVITISHAFEISKLESNYQKDLYEEHFTDSRRENNWWNCPTVKGLKTIIERNFTLKLSDASFNPEDKTLHEKAGSCTSCHKNTASDLSLFPDSPASGLCIDRVCYKKKTDLYFESELKKVQENPEIILGIPNYLYGEDSKQADSLKKQGVQVVEITYSKGFNEVRKPELPEAPIREENDSEEDYRESLDAYNNELNEFDEEMLEYERNLASGKLRQVFMTAGSDKGKILLYEVRKTAEHDGNESGPDMGLKNMIKELQDKDKRNAEIAFEKTYLDVKELIKKNLYSNIERKLTETEWQAVYILLLDFIGFVPLLEELSGSGKRYIDNKEKAVIASKLDVHQINRLFRTFLQNKLDTSSPNYQISEAKVLIDIATECYPDTVKEIELKHQNTYLKRKEGIEKRIDELQNPIS